MIAADRDELLGLIDAFVSGRDRSRHCANQIEGMVIEFLQDEDWFFDVSEPLALFVPGGSGWYIDEDKLARVLVRLAERLRAGTHPSSPGSSGDG